MPEPIVVFEVLSTSTADTDRIDENEEYRLTPSIRQYVTLEQTRRAATVFARDGGSWTGHVLNGDMALEMPGIGVDLPLSEIYAGIPFASDGEPPEGA